MDAPEQSTGSKLTTILSHGYTILAILVMLLGFVIAGAQKVSHTEDALAALSLTSSRHEDELKALRGKQDEIVQLLYSIKGRLESRSKE